LSQLNLNSDETAILTELGWKVEATEDGPKFSMDFSDFQVVIAPIVKRNLAPMSFRTQAQRYSLDYSDIAVQVGWGGRKSFGAGQNAEAMSTFKIERFDDEFARTVTKIVEDWVMTADVSQVVADRIERRRKVRNALSLADFIDYAYLGRTEDLQRILRSKSDESCEHIVSDDVVGSLDRAIEISKNR
jgi:hypothetical protein